MVVPVIYPASLPCPRMSDVQAKERRLLSPQAGVGGPMRSRVLQRDLLQREQLSFIFTFEQAEVFRVWWQDVLIYGGNWWGAHWPLPQGVPDGGYRFRRFVGAPTWSDFIPGVGWSVTAVCEVRGLGTPEVIDSGVSTWPVAISHFLDTFTGDVGPLTGHTPDIASEGFAYFDNNAGQNTTLQLDGSGRAVAVPIGYATSGTASTTASSPPLSIIMTPPFTVTLVGRPSDTMNDSVVVLKLRSADNSYIDLTLSRGSYTYYLMRAEMISNADGGGYFYAIQGPTDVAVEHTISLYVEATQATAYFDGVAGTPTSLEGSPVTTFEEIRYILDFDHPTDNAYISLVEVKPGAP